MAIIDAQACARDSCARPAHTKWAGLCRTHHIEYTAARVLNGVKVCTHCREEKPLSEFGIRSDRGEPKPKPRCHPCVAKTTAEWRERNPDYGRRWYRKNRERHAAYSRYQKYGITADHLAEMVLAQNGCCAICAVAMDVPNVDHDHSTGAVRDLLCRKCNSALGLFNEDLAVMRSAIAYLEKHAT